MNRHSTIQCPPLRDVLHTAPYISETFVGFRILPAMIVMSKAEEAWHAMFLQYYQALLKRQVVWTPTHSIDTYAWDTSDGFQRWKLAMAKEEYTFVVVFLKHQDGVDTEHPYFTVLRTGGNVIELPKLYRAIQIKSFEWHHAKILGCLSISVSASDLLWVAAHIDSHVGLPPKNQNV